MLVEPRKRTIPNLPSLSQRCHWETGIVAPLDQRMQCIDCGLAALDGNKQVYGMR
jgi:hypothetical protein